MLNKIGVQVIHGETDAYSFSGKRTRKQTVLLQVGKLSISKKAFLLGAALIVCQFLDGLLTYMGLSLLGVSMEGNAFLRELMHAYGMELTLFMVKTAAILLALTLMFHAHTRRWVRPIIAFLVMVYVCLAVVPWIMVISETHKENNAVAEIISPSRKQ